MAEEKKVLTITEEVRELVYDIQNKAFLTGRTHEATKETGYESASNMQASNDAEDSYEIKRSIADAFATLKGLLGEWLVEEKSTTNNRIDRAIDDGGQLTLVLNLPSNYNSAAGESVGNNVHAYLVASALARWFAITNKGEAEGYAARATSHLEMAKRALYQRRRPERPVYGG